MDVILIVFYTKLDSVGEDRQMNQDWVEDDLLTREETMARFRALGPSATRGPLPAGGVIITVPPSYGPGAISRFGGNPLRVTHMHTGEAAAPRTA